MYLYLVKCVEVKSVYGGHSVAENVFVRCHCSGGLIEFFDCCVLRLFFLFLDDVQAWCGDWPASPSKVQWTWVDSFVISESEQEVLQFVVKAPVDLKCRQLDVKFYAVGLE